LPTLRKTIEKHRSLQTTSPELPSQLLPHFDSFAFMNMLEQKSKLIRKGLHIDDCHKNESPHRRSLAVSQIGCRAKCSRAGCKENGKLPAR
jgi:hypothetical protein